jgi:hypothetical protein
LFLKSEEVIIAEKLSNTFIHIYISLDRFLDNIVSVTDDRFASGFGPDISNLSETKPSPSSGWAL